MPFPLTRLALLSALLLAAPTSQAADAPLAGKYTDGNLSIDLAQSADGQENYTGTITLRNKQYPAEAHPNGQQIEGTFAVGNAKLPFTATLAGDLLTLSSGNTTYTLKRVPPPANALDTNPPAVANPLDAAPKSAADAPAGYTLEASTDSGKSIATKKPSISEIKGALIATFSDLATYFGNRPSLGAAFQDAKDSTVGNATFSATFNGQPVRGIISCKIQQGAAISVIFLRSDAPKGDWEKLMAQTALKHASAAAAQSPFSAAPDPQIPLKEYDYPDGTGSIGLADGWTTQATSAAQPCFINGPAGQQVILHTSINVNPPDSIPARQYQHYEDQMQNAIKTNAFYRLKQIPPPLIAPLADPVTDLPAMMQQFSNVSEFKNGPTLSFEKILSSHDLPSSLQGGKAAFIAFTYTSTLRGQATLMRQEAQVMTKLVLDPTWMWDDICSVSGPDATFDRDLPIMMAMAKSEKVNPDQLQKIVGAIGGAYLQRGADVLRQSAIDRQISFENFQQSQQTNQSIHDAQMAQTQRGYDDINRAANQHEFARSRQDADQVEAILGTRMVYDTVTGESGYANLTDVTSVVDSLNQEALDPNRFIQIPLRDQLYPLPGPQ